MVNVSREPPKRRFSARPTSTLVQTWTFGSVMAPPDGWAGVAGLCTAGSNPQSRGEGLFRWPVVLEVDFAQLVEALEDKDGPNHSSRESRVNAG